MYTYISEYAIVITYTISNHYRAMVSELPHKSIIASSIPQKSKLINFSNAITTLVAEMVPCLPPVLNVSFQILVWSRNLNINIYNK